VKIALVLPLLLLAACGGGAEPTTIASMAGKVGCAPEAFDSEGLYVQDSARCKVGEETAYLYTFSDDEARDAWAKIATTFGSKVVMVPAGAYSAEQTATVEAIKAKVG
jgi:hypothetical protein